MDVTLLLPRLHPLCNADGQPRLCNTPTMRSPAVTVYCLTTYSSVAGSICIFVAVTSPVIGRMSVGQNVFVGLFQHYLGCHCVNA